MRLSDYQRVIELVSKGKANRHIAAELGIREATVQNRLDRIYRGVGVANRTELIILALSSERPLVLSFGPEPAPPRARRWRSMAVSLYQKGESLSTIEQKLRVDHHQISAALKEQGIEIRPQYPRRFDHDKAAELYKSGKSLSETAKILGARVGSVRRALKKSSIASHPSGGQRRFDHDKAAELYQSGKSLREIATIVGVSFSPVWKVLKKRGVGLRPGLRPFSQPRAFDHDKAAELYQSGKSLREIATIVGVSSSAVWKVLKKRGVTIRRDVGSRFGSK